MRRYILSVGNADQGGLSRICFHMEKWGMEGGEGGDGAHLAAELILCEDSALGPVHRLAGLSDHSLLLE